MARAGTDEAKVKELKELYGKILADKEVADWLHDTMLLEVDTMSVEDVEAHVENVKNIVNEYKDIVAG
jgi:tripartite-type tricarboxylate transporter receptor subunit TctC